MVGTKPTVICGNVRLERDQLRISSGDETMSMLMKLLNEKYALRQANCGHEPQIRIGQLLAMLLL